MSKEVKRYGVCDFYPGITEQADGPYVGWDVYESLLAENEALRAERDAFRNDHGSMRNAMKNARYRIEQGRVWNGMGWTLTGLHAYQQQVALDEIDAALQGAQP